MGARGDRAGNERCWRDSRVTRSRGATGGGRTLSGRRKVASSSRRRTLGRMRGGESFVEREEERACDHSV